MSGVVSFLFTQLQPYYKIIVAISIAILFIIATYYIYKTVYLPSQKKRFDDVANMNKQSTIIIYFFYANWCPHCNAAKPEWDRFKQQNDDRLLNGYYIRCIDVDCSMDNGGTVVQYVDAKGNITDMNKELATFSANELIEKYGIDGYPTIKMIKDGVTIEFESKITQESLNQFAETMSK